MADQPDDRFDKLLKAMADGEAPKSKRAADPATANADHRKKPKVG